MPSQQNALSPALFGVLLEQVAAGHVRPASLVSNVQNDQPIAYKNHAAKMTKERPGHFIITFTKDGQEVGQEAASTPVEAKLMVLDYMVQQVRAAMKEAANA